MTRYVKMTRKALAAELRARNVMDGWIVTYLSKEQIIDALESSDKLGEGERVKLPEQEMKDLEERKNAHRLKTKTAKIARNARHGTTGLTVRELLTHIVNSYPGLRYYEKRVRNEPFDTLTGKSATVVNVFLDAEGREHMFTRNECRVLAELAKEHGLEIEIPKAAFQHTAKTARDRAREKGLPTLADLW